MDVIKLEMIQRQVTDLGNLLTTTFAEIDQHIQLAIPPEKLKQIRNVYAVGDGDSFHAAVSAELSFLEFAGVVYYPREAMRFLEYTADYIDTRRPASNLVIGISSSGGTARVIQAIEKTKTIHEDIQLVAMVGNPESKVAQAAKAIVSVQIPSFGASPGIRTFSASLMGLIALAIRIGEARGRLSKDDVTRLHQEILSLAKPIDDLAMSSAAVAQQAAQQFHNNSFISFVGSGPSLGSALFSSAKVVEIAGLYSVAQDLEEWAHVEGLAYPLNYPVYLVAPTGKSTWRAEKLAYLVTSLGHPLIVVGQKENALLQGMASYYFPLETEVCESFSPLITHVPAHLFAKFLAQELNRAPFMGDNEVVQGYYAAARVNR